MTSSEVSTNFAGFSQLDECFRIRLLKGMFLDARNLKKLPLISMQFELANHETLADIRIEVSELSRLLFNSQFSSIAIKLLNTGKSSGQIEETHIREADLCLNVFLLLSDILKYSPEKQRGPLPQIWINGYGKVLKAVYAGAPNSPDTVFPNKFSRLKNEDMQNLATAQAKFSGRLELNSECSCFDVGTGKNHVNLGAVWNLLQGRYGSCRRNLW